MLGYRGDLKLYESNKMGMSISLAQQKRYKILKAQNDIKQCQSTKPEKPYSSKECHNVRQTTVITSKDDYYVLCA
jgi:hypothetical protein